MRLFELTRMDTVSSFTDAYFKQNLPASLNGASASDVFVTLARVVQDFKSKANRFFAKNDIEMHIFDLTARASEGLNGAAFTPIYGEKQQIIGGDITIDIPAVSGEIYDNFKKDIVRYMASCISHEIGHGIQLSGKHKGDTIYLKTIQHITKSSSSEERKLLYLSAPIETEMHSYSCAYDLHELARENHMPMKDLLVLAVTDRKAFLNYLNAPGLIALRSMFEDFYTFPDSELKQKTLKRFLKKFYQYAMSIDKIRNEELRKSWD